MDKQLIKEAQRKRITSVYQAADLISNKHGAYRFNMTRDAAKKLMADMLFASKGKQTPDIALEFGFSYLFMQEGVKEDIRFEETI